ncbi:potassium voltage-gated channel subfamily C member 3-like [Mytilus trossulus]|uniref:potassium voltage-gated channel subfamily C member 3-like n=1 Tax=Mytilus trossulus TaxID=6551 RepID=UPI00300487C9
MAIIHINVGGTLFHTKLSTLQRFPETLLGSITTTSEFYNGENKYFYFDRNPELFNTILDYYRNGVIHLPTHLCGWLWKSELEFWRIPLTNISECCFQTYIKYEEKEATAAKLREIFAKKPLAMTHLLTPINKIRQKVWMLIDEPTSSTYARVFSIIYLIIVIVSATIPCLETHPNLRIHLYNDTQIYWFFLFNPDTWVNTDNPKEIMFTTTLEPSWLFELNVCIIVFFTLESLVRFMTCPSKCRFFLEWLNILDTFLNITMWSRFMVDMFANVDAVLEKKFESLMYFYSFCSAASVLRLLKFFRVAKQYNSLRVLFLAVKASVKELGLLLLTFLIVAWVFSNLIYYAELKEPDTFPNMLDGLWWAVVTMTTVGYGDMYPTGALGRIIGATCAMCGLLVIAMPIAVIAGNFDDLYKKNNERESYNEIQKEKGTERKQSVNSITAKDNKIVPFEKSKLDSNNKTFPSIER